MSQKSTHTTHNKNNYKNKNAYNGSLKNPLISVFLLSKKEKVIKIRGVFQCSHFVPLFYDTDLFYFKVKLVLETNSSLSKTFTK